MLRYDRARGVAQALDLTAGQEPPAFVDLTDAEAVAHTIAESDALFEPLPALLAGYGVALAARAWSGRPSDARRGAIIQAGQLLQQARPADIALSRIVEQCRTLANAAILRGEDAEAAIVAFVESEARRRDKAAERCGRRAAELLDDGNHALILGGAGIALHWMLQTASVEQKKNITLHIAAAASAQLTINWAQAQNISAHLQQKSGVRDQGSGTLWHHNAAPDPAINSTVLPTAIIDDDAILSAFAQGAFSLCLTTAEQIAMDGSIAARDTQHYATLCRQHNIPFYVLGDDGPDPESPTGEHLLQRGSGIRGQGSGMIGQHNAVPDRHTGSTVLPAAIAPEMIAPALISAIVTSRGIYRPEMIARHLEEGDAPLDVIPLAG
jgi:methylthioribose-1-phosphate isomerase